ncbi:MAG: ECF transporter S component [Oscillospiraceae bacterium]|nr:ECF transporter S component [Oscillospiraceae bacterium]
MDKSKSFNVRKFVMLALFTAIVVVLQSIGAFIRFGPFSISLVLLPIVVGAALNGMFAGFWLGLVFGLVVLFSGDATVFMGINLPATILVVLGKGAFAGLAAGTVHKLLAKKGRTVAALAAAIVCPVINTGLFVVGLYAFFWPTISEWGTAAGFTNTAAYVFLGMIGANFLFEIVVNVVLSPVIVRLVQYAQERRATAS